MSCQKCGLPGHNRRTCEAGPRRTRRPGPTLRELVGRATPEICEEIQDLLEKAHQDISRAKHRGRDLLTHLPPENESWEHDLRLIQWLDKELDTLDSVTKRLTYLFRPPPTNTPPPEETP